MELDESRFAIFELDEKQSEKELLQQGFDGGNELRNYGGGQLFVGKARFVNEKTEMDKGKARLSLSCWFGFEMQAARLTKDFRRRQIFGVFALYTGTLKKSLPVCILVYRNTFFKTSGLVDVYRNSLRKCSGRLFVFFANRNSSWKCSVVRRRGADGQIPVRTLDRGASSSAAAAEPTGYPGGPYDTSLLVKYEHHVARHIWFGEERGPKKELKVVGHGLKLTSRVPLALPPQMESWVSRSGLASLQRMSLNKIDTNLVSAFVERWHLETSSFHMPFGEMSITLDDVACLLHLPIRGIFWSPQDVTEELAVELAVDYLGVSQGQAQSHVRSCRGSYYKLEWLYDIFVHHRAASSWAYATRAYLLMLVGSTIFADKTFTLVEARYLLLFRDLDKCSGYSWGAAPSFTNKFSQVVKLNLNMLAPPMFNWALSQVYSGNVINHERYNVTLFAIQLLQ
ncbi:uncharacterized protein LOC127093828 [Lathyrus oleraceus]|uniref:uncharacterized protein LOC127093828 n=1 Tax=Pisum sativum TaxID=3888 RepID=UPI0021D07149|nr:uncharacterized protein LOC127093828 [Pisum sativum]